jgi:hypothetical protein
VGVRLPFFDAKECRLAPAASEPLARAHLVLLSLTSDQGSDQAASGRRLQQKLALVPHVLFMHTFCAIHQCHLIVGKQLRRAGDYVGRLASLAHLWRAPLNRERLRAAFTSLHGEQRAERTCSTLLQIPLRGRWGAVHACKEHLLLSSRHELHTAPQS